MDTNGFLVIQRYGVNATRYQVTPSQLLIGPVIMFIPGHPQFNREDSLTRT